VSIGVIAGAGRFPLLLLREAARRGPALPTVALARVALPAVTTAAGPSAWLPLGQLDRTARFLRAQGAEAALLAGGVRRSALGAMPRPDARAARLLPSVTSRGPPSPRAGSGFATTATWPTP
jgi:DUF1009 family protein